jgi:hypothetical protein
MMIAHLPAGYLATRALAPRYLVAGLAGAIAPDLDMLWWLASGGHTHHHAYPTHFPSVWLGGLVACWLLRRPMGVVFAANGLLHLGLDTLVGDIAWLAPFDMRRASLFVVTDRFDPWWLNFVLHGSFGLELALCVAAGVVALRSARSTSDGNHGT